MSTASAMHTRATRPIMRKVEATASLRGATVILDDRPILRDVTVELGPGLTLVRGPNGAGKTTLLRALAGLVPLARGVREMTGDALYIGHRPMLLRGLTARAPGARRSGRVAHRDRPRDREPRVRDLDRIGLVAVRELRAERRQPDGIVAAVTFITVLVLLESLVVGPAVARDADVASALFWLALAFATILATMRSFDRELEDDALEGLVALPGGRDALFGGKVLALSLVVALVAAIGGLLSLVLLDLPLALPLHLIVVVALGVIALPPVVVVDVVLALRLRARAALVPVLALPVLVPHLLAASHGAAAALGGDATGAWAWSGLLAAIALVYLVLGLSVVPAALD